jgi:hypothetical protein
MMDQDAMDQDAMDQDAMDQDSIRTTLSTHDNTQTWSMTLHKCGT